MKWIASLVLLGMLGCTCSEGPKEPAGSTAQGPTAKEVVAELLASTEFKTMLQEAVNHSRARPGPSMRAKSATPKPPEKPPGLGPGPLNCEASCKTYGNCTLRDAKCIATSSSECKESLGCKLMGNCAFFPEESEYVRCRPGSESDCRKSDGCTKSERCTLRERRCVK